MVTVLSPLGSRATPNRSSPWTLLSTSRARCLHHLAALRNGCRSHDRQPLAHLNFSTNEGAHPLRSLHGREFGLSLGHAHMGTVALGCLVERGCDVYNIAAHPPAACASALLRIARIAARAASRPALFPQLFPIPEPVCHLFRQRESELMREHTHLPAMVGFVRKHVAQHFHPNRPRPSPAVSAKLLDPAATIAERFREHLRAASGALGQSRTSLPRRAASTVELGWNL